MLTVLVLIIAFPIAAASADVTDLPSVTVGGRCVFRGMPIKKLVEMFSTDPRWEFRWDEKMVKRDGIVAGLFDRRGSENPYLLQFSFAGKTVGEARLTRIGWGGKQSEWTSTHERRLGCK